MKFLIICAFIAVANAGAFLHAPVLTGTGASAQYRSQDNFGNYAFGYDEGHSTGGTFRKESGDSLGNKAGSYGLRDADGRLRIVNYVADGLGFRANIQSNEPGVEPKDPAAVAINKAAPLALAGAAPIASYALPVPAAYSYAHAPLSHGYSSTTYHHGLAASPLVYKSALPFAHNYGFY